MALKLEQIGAKIVTTLINDASIIAKCKALYSGSTQTVYYRAAGPESPDADEYPLLAVHELTESRGELDEDKIYRLEVDCVVSQTAKTTTANEVNGDTVNSVTYQGPLDVKQILDLVRAAVIGMTNELTWEELEVELFPMQEPPIFMGTLHITCSIPNLIGGAEPSLT